MSIFLRLLRWTLLAGTIGLALVAGALLLVAQQPHWLIPTLADQVERETGRSLSIGNIKLISARPITLVVRDLHLGNPDWRGGDLLRLDYLRFEVYLGGLLRKRLELPALEVHGLVVDIAERAGRQPTWALLPTADEVEESGVPWDIVLGPVNVTEVAIGVDVDVDGGDPVALELGWLRLRTDSGGLLDLAATGRVDGHPVGLEALGGPLSDLLAGQTVSLDVDLAVAEGAMALRDASLSLDPLTPHRAIVRASVPEISHYTQRFGLPSFLTGPLVADGTLDNVDGRLQLDAEARVGDYEVELRGELADVAGLDDLSARISVAGPDLAAVMESLAVPGAPAGAFSAVGEFHYLDPALTLKDVDVALPGASLRVDAALPALPGLEGASISLTGQVATPDTYLQMAGLGGTSLPSTRVSASLAGERFDVDLSLGEPEHRVLASGQLGTAPDYHDTSGTVSVAGGDLAALLAMAAVESPYADKYSINGSFRYDAAGISARELVVELVPVSFRGALATDLVGVTADGDLAVTDLAELGAVFDLEPPLPALPVTAEVKVDFEPAALAVHLADTRLAETVSDIRLALNPDEPGEVAIRLRSTGQGLQQLAGQELPLAGDNPYRLDADVTVSEQQITVREFSAEVLTNRVHGAGVVNLDRAGTQLRLTASGDSLHQLFPGIGRYETPDMPFDLTAGFRLPDQNSLEVRELSAALGQATLSGQLDIDLDVFEAGRADLHLHGKSMAELGRFDGRQLPSEPFGIDLTLRGDGAVLNIEEASVNWAGSSFEASGIARMVEVGGGNPDSTSDEIPDIILQAHSPRLDIRDLQQLLAGDPEDEQDEASASQRLIPDTPLPISQLRAANVDVDVQIDNYIGRSADLKDVQIKGTLKDGSLALERLAYSDRLGAFNLSGVVAASADNSRLSVAVQGQAREFSVQLLTSGNQDRGSAPVYSMDATLRGSGGTPAAIVGSLNGRILVSSEGGVLDNRSLELFAGDFLMNVISRLNPFVSQERTTKMDCIVLNASVTDGRVKLAPGAIIRTDKVNMQVVGRINLGTERLDMSMATSPRRGLGLSVSTFVNPFFKVGGTLSSPQIQLDTTSAAVASSLIAATGGLSIVAQGVWDRLRGEQDMCQQYLKKWEEQPRE